MSIDPRHLSWQQWSSETKALYFPSLPSHTDEDNWKDWAAMAASAIPALAAVHIPLPQFYQNWQDWAFRFSEYAALAGL